MHKWFAHSAKGTTWKEHKYIKKVNGSYYYPEDMENLTDKDRENLANETIKGSFGNGQTRKDLLGKHYSDVQSKVNEILGVKKTDKVSMPKKEDKKSVDKAVTKVKGINLDTVYSVYRKKK